MLAKTHFSLLTKGFWQPSCAFQLGSRCQLPFRLTLHTVLLKNGQLGQNLLGRNEDFLKDKSIPVWFNSHCTRKLNVTVWSVSSWVQVAEREHYHPWCNQKKPAITSVAAVQLHANTQRRISEWSLLLLEEQDGDDDDDNQDHGQNRAHNPQHFRLLHPLSHAVSHVDRVWVGTGWKCHL